MRSKATAVMVNYRKLVNVQDFDSWTWDALVDAARKATDMRYRIEETVKTTYGDYIARLTMASAVKRGGIKEFCEEAGLNYGTVKNWRSQYLTAEQKREYKLKEPEPEPELEPETIVIIDDNSAEESDGKASDLEVDFESVNFPVEQTGAEAFDFVVTSNIWGKQVDGVLIDNFLHHYVSERRIRSLTISFDGGEFISVESTRK